MRSAVALIFTALLWAGSIDNASAQISDGVIKIGVLSNQSTVGADASGVAAATAARLAVEDFGGAINSVPVQVIDEDFAEKPDSAALIARRWFDTEKVDAIADMPVSSAALAVQEIARKAKKTLLIGGAATADLTGKACSPFTTHWTDNSRALTSAVVQGVTEKLGETWFFVAVDYARGLRCSATPPPKSSARAARSWAACVIRWDRRIWLRFCSRPRRRRRISSGSPASGKDTINAIKEAQEFRLQEFGQQLAAFLVFITDIHGLGLAAAQGLNAASGFTGIRMNRPGNLPSGCLPAIRKCRPRNRQRSTRRCGII